jgi:hypothetical protein
MRGEKKKLRRVRGSGNRLENKEDANNRRQSSLRAIITIPKALYHSDL